MIKTAAIILCCVSWSFAVVCPTGYIEWNGGCSADLKPETAPSVQPSDEKPPRSGMPGWQANGIHVVDIRAETAADEHHPTSCPNNCLWDGGTCSCNNDSAKKPQ